MNRHHFISSRSITLLVFFSAVVFFTGCEKDKIDCNKIVLPYTSSNSPVNYNDDIELTSTEVKNVFRYNWSGPNNFTAETSTQVIYNASQVNAGTYYMTATTTDGCVTDTSFTTVIVNIPSAPCNPTNNYYELNGINMVNLSNVHFGSTGSSPGKYEVTCSASSGSLHVYFATTTKPLPGVYKITSLGSQSASNEVALTNNTVNSLWQTSSGDVYISELNNKIIITYCDVTFPSSTFSISTQGSRKITEP